MKRLFSFSLIFSLVFLLLALFSIGASAEIKAVDYHGMTFEYDAMYDFSEENGVILITMDPGVSVVRIDATETGTSKLMILSKLDVLFDSVVGKLEALGVKVEKTEYDLTETVMKFGSYKSGSGENFVSGALAMFPDDTWLYQVNFAGKEDQHIEDFAKMITSIKLKD